MKTKITAELSRNSLKQAIKLLREFESNYKKGVHDSIKSATEAMYNKVLQNCYENGISNHTGEIHWEYDDSKNIGRVWTNDMVLIFNEMGTGVKGQNKPHPKVDGWEYDINGHGEQGWWYPTTDNDPNPIKRIGKDGQLRGWTAGLPSRRMFYDAYESMKNEIGDYVEIELRKNIGNLY